jgi:predicted phage baseplate assembly protein
VSWRKEDALTWDACVSLNGVQAIGVNGNLVRASHGKTVLNEAVDLDSMTLQQGPLTWLYSPSLDSLFPPDVALPREAVSTIQLTVNGEPWFEEPSLLDSSANDPDFVVETDDTGRGVLRFGNGDLGRKLPKLANVVATYRVGNGTAGNVGYETLFVAPIGLPAGVSSVNNPLPAVGGIDPEDLAIVRRDAPQAFRRLQYRAVTIDDYAAAARRVPGVFDAAAYFRWTGSWLTVFVAVDPVGRLDLAPAVSDAVVAQLETYRQAGYDLEVRGPDYVPLDIALTVCVLPDYFQADVMREVQMRLATMGSSGFFSPNQFTFGQSLYLSRLVAAVQDITGVKGVHATVFKKLFIPAGNELFDGLIRVGNLQIIRADNNPSRPENGRVVLTPEGGK